MTGLEEPLSTGLSSEAFWREFSTDELLPHPARIGSYEIRRVLGTGSSGVVYLARQANPDREVAVKVLRPGVSGVTELRRFELEARVLGRLQHAGIAQVYEAGLADLGYGPQPYFAMEYVPGPSLTRHAAERGLGLRERIELLLQLCDAVSYAHQRGVVHRDLSPSNVLVDERGTARVVDFGLAHVDADWRSASLRTQDGQVLGTVPYMSPEQISGLAEDVDTRADVYALGVIAYELLTGRLPHDVRGRSIAEAARQVCEQDPAPAGRWNPDLKGDLEAILEKALAREKERRYQGAHELAADLRRSSRSEPVTARAPGALYLLERYARRHRPRLIAAAIALVGVLAGGVAATVGLFRATRAEIRLRERYEEARASIEFLIGEVLSELQPRLGTGDVQRPLLEELRRQVERLREDRPEDPRLLASLARTLESLGVLEVHEGRVDEARRLQQTVLEIRRELVARDAGNRQLRTELSISHVRLGDLARRRGDLERALEWYEPALRIDEELAAADPDDRRLQDTLCWSYERVGHALTGLGRFDQAEELLLRRYELATRLLHQRPDSLMARFNMCASHAVLTNFYRANQELVQAREHARACLRIAEELVQAAPQNMLYVSYLANSLWALADLDLRHGDAEEADRLMRRSTRWQRILAESAPRDDEQLERTFTCYLAWLSSSEDRRSSCHELLELGRNLEARSPGPWATLMQIEAHGILAALSTTDGEEDAVREHRSCAARDLRELSRRTASHPERDKIACFVSGSIEELLRVALLEIDDGRKDTAEALVALFRDVQGLEETRDLIAVALEPSLALLGGCRSNRRGCKNDPAQGHIWSHEPGLPRANPASRESHPDYSDSLLEEKARKLSPASGGGTW